MRVYIDTNENIDNISELYAYIRTRDGKYIRLGGDVRLWATEEEREERKNITESEYDKIIAEEIQRHEDLKCKDAIITYFILDALIIRERLFYDN